jgi:SAM-dependent methyltransferase
VNRFDLYSQYYDLLYRDKNYRGEADYVLSLLRRFSRNGGKKLLELGCGTGRHAALFAEAGFDVTGVDMSDTMLERARKNHPDIAFVRADARHVKLGSKFDAVTSLFHVASYQTGNQDFSDYLESVRSHLLPGGLFIFDYWHGPGVLTDLPETRQKHLESGNFKVVRTAIPTLHPSENVVNVHYQILAREQGDDETHEISEDHRMRYFFLPEIGYCLGQHGMKLLDSFEWMTTKTPSLSSWTACSIATLS